MSISVEIPILTKAIGGLLPRQTYLFHGEPSVGKTVLGIQVASAWIAAGRTVLYLTGERGCDLLEHARTLDLPLHEQWQSGRLQLCECVASLAREVDGAGMPALLARMDEVARQAPISAVILDPLDRLISRRASAGNQRRIMEELLEGFQQRGWSALLLAGNECLRRNPAAREILMERCWATAKMGRPDRNSPRAKLWGKQVLENTFLLDIEKSRQPTPQGEAIAYQITRGAGLIPAPDRPSVFQDGEWTPRDPGPQRPRILFASENPNLFLALARLLRRDYETEIVTDGVMALSRAVTWNPQAIVCETEMPRLSGFAIGRVLRQGRYAMPLLLISPNARRHSERARAYLNGATDFAYFPYDLNEMIFRIRTASQMRLEIPPGMGIEPVRDLLLERASSHVLDMPTFMRALALSIGSGLRIASPVSLVTFSFHTSPGNAAAWGAWRSFREMLDQRARAGDLVCFPQEGRAAVLLCHETRKGVSAFSRRIRRLAQTHPNLIRVRDGKWRIMISSETLTIPEDDDLDLQEIFAAAFAQPGAFLAAEDLALLDGEERSWGT